ncbi:Uncharacterized protein conserved in bacteria [Mycoplasma putrefaciens]|uniref:Uncharacterized protein n=1 Tax=Mycoplasma putrefaciens (strain ATCC 15718 / NCTC 10155 / C30 KS-1 / KS-1) TaxID=743965 RepID=A0A7U4E9E4_MYCPK|nr:DUF896 domain-containing protein [Mycoplasma putrefaciens]AEM68824.1 uncharacterized protein MPUT_0452 [Mycoplasma putrefaciens KS1]SYV96133.1 Uncharacterized protein conserved in bacteria [Mycoplasma putrefaciens]
MSEKIEEMTMQEVVVEINNLAKIKNTRPLIDQESNYRELLKKRYLELFQSSFKEQLLNVKVIDANNNDITPIKIKQLRKVNNNEK